MKIDVQDSFGKVIESIKLDSHIFNIKVNSSVVRQAVLSELSNEIIPSAPIPTFLLHSFSIWDLLSFAFLIIVGILLVVFLVVYGNVQMAFKKVEKLRS